MHNLARGKNFAGFLFSAGPFFCGSWKKPEIEEPAKFSATLFFTTWQVHDVLDDREIRCLFATMIRISYFVGSVPM